jgi:acyl-CoA thioester hydrolase
MGTMSGLAGYPHRRVLGTRWADNDVYGHVNNVEFYALFDTLCAESHCRYHAPLAFPDDVVGGLRVAELGRSSVRYELAIAASEDAEPAATGWFVHVFVDRDTRRPVPIEGRLRESLTRLHAPAAPSR